MDRDVIDRALASASDTRRIVARPGAIADVASVFGEVFGPQPAIVVADETTYTVAGAAVERSLRSSRQEVRPPIVLPASPPPHADYDGVLAIRDALRGCGATPIAVGSGTINDLTKLASHEAGRRYMVVATAASMDGYTAFGAAITRNGFKQTIACPAPRAVVADLDVLVRAPAELTASGFGDLIGKVTAGADWILADAVGVDRIRSEIWSMVQPAVREVVAEPERVASGDAAAVDRLFTCLVMSGLAMQAARSSRPASGSEHQFSHLWEMGGLHGQTEASHGFKVAIGTVAVAALYERILARDVDRLALEVGSRWPSLAEMEAEIRSAHADPALADQAVAQSRAKYVSAGQLEVRLRAIRARWPRLREQLRAQLLPAGEIRRILARADCPSDPLGIGIDPARLRASYGAARQIRSRYTVLDFAAETGTLGPILDELFAPDGFWGTIAAAHAVE